MKNQVRKRSAIPAKQVFILLSIMIAGWSCKRCELDHEVRVKLDWRYTNFEITPGSEWENYTAGSLQNALAAKLAAEINVPGEIMIVDTLPEYLLRIDSVTVYASEKTETYEDPCQEEHGALYNFLFGGPTHSTFQLHALDINSTITLLNATSNTGKRMRFGSASSEYVTQETTTDSLNCNPYYVAGIPDTADALRGLAIRTHTAVKSQICDWLH